MSVTATAMNAASENTRRHWTFGSNELFFEDGILVMESHSSGTLEEFRATVQVFEELAKEGPYYLVTDLSDLKIEFPKHFAGDIQRVKLAWFKKSVLVGMNRPMKLATKAVIIGLCLVGQPDVTSFADTRAEAMEMIRKHRALEASVTQ